MDAECEAQFVADQAAFDAELDAIKAEGAAAYAAEEALLERNHSTIPFMEGEIGWTSIEPQYRALYEADGSLPSAEFRMIVCRACLDASKAERADWPDYPIYLVKNWLRGAQSEIAAERQQVRNEQRNANNRASRRSGFWG